jgi:hypothetical protein
MISYLIDGVLVAALAFTSWRTGGMYRELRRLRSEGANFAVSLQESDVAINRAAHAVVMLRSEGVDTLHSLEEATRAARELADRLEDAVHLAELKLSAANDGPPRADLTSPTQDTWLTLIESRLASASTANR